MLLLVIKAQIIFKKYIDFFLLRFFLKKDQDCLEVLNYYEKGLNNNFQRCSAKSLIMRFLFKQSL